METDGIETKDLFYNVLNQGGRRLEDGFSLWVHSSSQPSCYQGGRWGGENNNFKTEQMIKLTRNILNHDIFSGSESEYRKEGGAKEHPCHTPGICPVYTNTIYYYLVY